MASAITKEQVQAMPVDKVRLIDIRSSQEFEKMHIPDSINIPADILSKELEKFNSEDTIVCVCNYGKDRGQQAAELIYNTGFKNTFYLQGGAFGWLDEKSETKTEQ